MMTNRSARQLLLDSAIACLTLMNNLRSRDSEVEIDLVANQALARIEHDLQIASDHLTVPEDFSDLLEEWEVRR